MKDAFFEKRPKLTNTEDAFLKKRPKLTNIENAFFKKRPKLKTRKTRPKLVYQEPKALGFGFLRSRPHITASLPFPTSQSPAALPASITLTPYSSTAGFPLPHPAATANGYPYAAPVRPAVNNKASSAREQLAPRNSNRLPLPSGRLQPSETLSGGLRGFSPVYSEAFQSFGRRLPRFFGPLPESPPPTAAKPHCRLLAVDIAEVTKMRSQIRRLARLRRFEGCM